MANSDREKQLFLAALELPTPAEREAFLRGACAHDSDLYQRLHVLIAMHDQSRGPLDQPPTGLEPAATRLPLSPETVGAEIGPYKLLQQIGEGGMGSVFLADQREPVRRRVALKVIKPGMDSAQVIARFDAERQALSLMDHPNIAKVLDAGTTVSGRPYFVMELVRGQPITQYCDEQHLTPRERLELFLPVCHAIQHAHQKGIIHRDVKPSNVLVAEYDGRPVAKVIDFGVAKAICQPLTEKTVFTGHGQIVGTLEYMSPEQSRVNQLDIDTRSDIYSLGVLLYELLTGTTPFDRQRLRSAAWDEMLRIIREEEPPRPSTKLSSSETLPSVAANRQTEPGKLSALIRGELDWIVMKTLEKDRARRYETANGLASDIQRYLRDEPVQACPPSASYRFRKFARRNKVAFVTTGIVAVSLVLGLLGTSWQAFRATRAEQRARDNEQLALENERMAVASARAEASQRKRAEEAAQAESQAKEAEAQQRRQAEAAEKIAADEAAAAQAVNDFLQQDLLGLADAEAQLNAGIAPDPDVKLRTLLDRALAHVNTRFGDQPRIRTSVKATLASAYFAIGSYEQAASLWEQVVTQFQQSFGGEHLDTLTYTSNLASVYHAQGRHADAESLYGQTLETAQRILGDEHSLTLTLMNNMAGFHLSQGRLADAESLCRRALEIRQRVLGEEHSQTLISMNLLAAIFESQERLAESEPLKVRVLEIGQRVLGAEHPIMMVARHNLANLYINQGRYLAAEPLCIQSLEIMRRALGNEHPNTLTAMSNLAALHYSLSHYAKAETLSLETLEIRRRVLGEDHPDTLTSMANLAKLYEAQNNYAAAESLFTRTLASRRRVLGDDHLDTLMSMLHLAEVFRIQHKYSEAEPILISLLAAQRRKLPDSAPQLSGTLSMLGIILIDTGRPAEAEPLLRESLQIRESIMPDAWTRFNTQSLLGECLSKQDKFSEAEPLLLSSHEELTARAEQIPGPLRHTRLIEAVDRLITHFESAGKPDAVQRWRQERFKGGAAESEPELAPDAPPPAPTRTPN